MSRIVQACSADDKERIFSFRYACCQEKDAFPVQGVNHEQKKIQDPFDTHADHYFFKTDADAILGSVAVCHPDNPHLMAPFRRNLALDKLVAIPPDRIAIFLSAYSASNTEEKDSGYAFFLDLHRLLVKNGYPIAITYCEPPFVFLYEQFGYRHYGSCFYNVDVKNCSVPVLLMLADTKYLNFVSPPYLSENAALPDVWSAVDKSYCDIIYNVFPHLANSVNKRTMSDKDMAQYVLSLLEGRKIKSLSIFEGLQEGEISYLMKNSSILKVEEGRRLIPQGQNSKEMYLVLEGLFEALKTNKLHLSFIWPGEIMGEIAFILGRTRTADVFALFDSKVLAISAATFEALMLDNPTLSLKIMSNLAKVLASRLVTLEERHFEEIKEYLEVQLQDGDEPATGRTLFDVT